MQKLLLALTILVSTLINAQGKNNDQIRALKVAHITSELNLTTKEAEKFWPIYNAHQKEMKSLHHKEKKTIKEGMANLGRLSEDGARDLLKTFKAQRKKKHEMDQGLIDKLEGVISTKKILLLIRSEANFKRNLLKQYGDRNRAVDLRRKAIEERHEQRKEVEDYKKSLKEEE